MSEEDFYAGKSRPVNRSLFEIFALSSLAEQSGHGVPLIVERYGKKAFDFSSGTIVVTIPFAFVPEPIKIQRYFSAKGPTKREIENKVLLFFSRAKHRLDAGMRLESRRQRILRQENRRIPSHARETQALWFPQGRVLDRVEEEFFGVFLFAHSLHERKEFLFPFDVASRLARSLYDLQAAFPPSLFLLLRPCRMSDFE